MRITVCVVSKFIFVEFILTFPILLKILQGKRSHRHHGWSGTRSKRSKQSEAAEIEDKSENRCAEENKSEELFLSEDSCSNCGLPNYPELVRDKCVRTC